MFLTSQTAHHQTASYKTRLIYGCFAGPVKPHTIKLLLSKLVGHMAVSLDRSLLSSNLTTHHQTASFKTRWACGCFSGPTSVVIQSNHTPSNCLFQNSLGIWLFLSYEKCTLNYPLCPDLWLHRYPIRLQNTNCFFEISCQDLRPLYQIKSHTCKLFI